MPKTVQEAGWAQERVWTIWEGKKLCCCSCESSVLRPEVLIMTAEFVVDLGTFRWERRSPFLIRNWCIPVKNTIGWSRVAFCAHEIIQLFPVVIDVVREANKFHFRFVINEIPHNWRPVESKSHSDKRFMFWQDLYVPFSRTSSRMLRTLPALFRSIVPYWGSESS